MGDVLANDIRLTFKELRILKKSIKNEISINTKEYQRLNRLGLVEDVMTCPELGEMPISNGFFVISSKGKDFIIYRQSDILIKWIPYWITTGIAVAALIISFIALLSELGLLQLPTDLLSKV